MKLTFLTSTSVAASLLAAAFFAAGAVAQAPQGAAPEAGGPPMRAERPMPAPTNLKVLPKDLNGHQVREIMETWAGSLGVHCDTCHAADPNKVGPNGRPRLDFPSDAKKDKLKARIMYSMTQDINKNYVSMVADKDDAEEAKVTCGTCHRGHLKPEAYVIPHEERRGPGGMPPGMGAPPPPPPPPQQ